MPCEMEKFQSDLLESVKQMGRREAERVTKVMTPEAAKARALVGLSQQDFALFLGVSTRTLQDWEQGAPGTDRGRENPPSCRRIASGSSSRIARLTLNPSSTRT